MQGLSVDHYAKNRLVRNAVERNFEIIGEALRRLTHHDPELASSLDHVAHAIAFRNLLIHGYDIVADELVWQVIEDDLPDLLQQVQVRLNEE